MKKTSKLVFSVAALLATMGFSAACCAEEVALPCGAEFVSPGIPKVIQTVTFKGVWINVNGVKQFVTTVSDDDPGYDGWRAAIRKQYDKKTSISILKAASVSVMASCSDSPEVATISDPPKTLTCSENAGISISTDCVCSADQQAVVDITKVSVKELEQELIELKEKAEMSRRQYNELAAKREADLRLIAEYGREIDGIENRIFGTTGGSTTSQLLPALSGFGLGGFSSSSH